MSNIAKLKKKAAELEQKKQFDKALAVYVQILENLDPREDEADVSLYNRVGDLLIRQGNVPEALNYYEKAVDLYADGGFFNNAIALCNKILRNAPGRSSIYYKLGKISAKKGFVSDAKQNFLEYADRMQKVGQIDEAFRALKEFADLCPDQDDIRLMLAEQLSKRDRKGEALEQLQVLYERLESEGRSAEARATIDRMKAIDPSVEPKTGGTTRKEKSSELVFLDVNYDDAPAQRPGPPTRGPSKPDAGPPPARSSGPAAGLPLIEPEPFSDLEGEPDLPPVDGVTHGSDFDASLDVGEPAAPDVTASPNGFESSTPNFDADLSDGFGRTLNLEEFGVRDGEQGQDASGFGTLDRLDAFDRPEHDLMLPGELPMLESPDARFSGTPDMEFMNDPFGSGSGAASLDDLSLPVAGDDERPSLGLDEDVPLILLDDGAESLAASLPTDEQAVDTPFFGGDDAFAIGGAAPPAADPNDPVENLRQRVAADESNPSLRRELAEALIERGDREGGLHELETAMVGFERGGDLDTAESIADEIIRLNPNSVRHHQKRVEYAFRTNDKPRLGEAYLELADALFRTGQPDKARSVYQRVLELAPDDVRAQAALSAFAEPAPPAAPPKKPAKPQKEQSGVFRRYTAEPAKPEPAPARPTPTASDDSLVNLGDWLRSEEGPRSTRMVVDERAPTGDEQADFGEMLRKFKAGVAQNIEEEDHESHYDLGVAYKEMGLLDEAIAEFQKALRGAHHRVRTYEALGQCFLEQSQFSVAATVLGRALSEQGYGDEQLVGVLYLLGYASEALQRWDVALSCYQRVYAVDIGFRDVASRIAALQRVAT